MPRFDASSAECLVLTFKEGLLSPVAHDLKLRVTDLRIDLDEAASRIEATFAAGSLRVVCAVRAGADDPGALSDKDRREIERNLASDVLHASRYPEIRFRSEAVTPEGSGHRVRGKLSLHGVEREVAFTVARQGDRWVAEVALHQPDFGIKPFKAMLGTLRVQAQVRVRVSLPG